VVGQDVNINMTIQYFSMLPKPSIQGNANRDMILEIFFTHMLRRQSRRKTLKKTLDINKSFALEERNPLVTTS
jgi:hypothetical protein